MGRKVSRTTDTSRAGAALARPGMDTRNWCLQAQVLAFKLDNKLGPMADVMLLPDGDEETVRVGFDYAGNGYGFYAPLEVDDLVLVSFPNGDYDAGGIITARVYGPGEVPPKTATDNPADVCLHVKDGKNLRLRVGGAGNLTLITEQGNIFLGAENLDPAQCGVVLAGGIDSFTGSTYGALQNSSLVVMAKKAPG